MEWTPAQARRLAAAALAGARGRSNPDARRRAVEAVKAGRMQVTAELDRDPDGVPIVASLAFRVDVEDAGGRWSPLCAAGWRVLGLDMLQVIAEADRVRGVAAAGGDGSVVAATPPDRAYVLDELPDAVGP
ncbi:hypothetical protein WEH80_38000 [Actinomycetes bacterium KLBMP 9759]